MLDIWLGRKKRIYHTCHRNRKIGINNMGYGGKKRVISSCKNEI